MDSEQNKTGGENMVMVEEEEWVEDPNLYKHYEWAELPLQEQMAAAVS